jgi:hypothetical protein
VPTPETPEPVLEHSKVRLCAYSRGDEPKHRSVHRAGHGLTSIDQIYIRFGGQETNAHDVVKMRTGTWTAHKDFDDMGQCTGNREAQQH